MPSLALPAFLDERFHPLRETIMTQTGLTVAERRSYLQAAYDAAKESLIHTWSPPTEATPPF